MPYVMRRGERIEVETLDTGPAPRRKSRRDAHIGCPIEWLKRVIPIVRSKQELAVAIWLWRRRTVCRSEWFTVPNTALDSELGLTVSPKLES